ncbi:hypothetical protein N9C24_04870, partial [Gammaproteobacteria bacterium]|nr:hypothetical protein [Gammaproteobacteria bacterium]
KISAIQREWVVTIDNLLRTRVRDAVRNARFDIVDLDNTLVKASWERTFHNESSIAEDSPYLQILKNLDAYISKNKVRRMGSVSNLSAKQARKVKNYVIWCSKNLPKFAGNVRLSSRSMNRVIREFGTHPVSDIVDSYMLARHLYYTDAYSGSIPYGDPMYVTKDQFLDNIEWDQLSARTAQITRETRENFKTGDKIIIDGIDTGIITLLQSEGTNDTHDPDVEFTFITRNESSNEKYRRLRKEYRDWRNN